MNMCNRQPEETEPRRLQRKRCKGWRMGTNGVCVTRPGRWGNPFTVGWWLNPATGERFPHRQKWTRRINVPLSLELFREYAESRLSNEPDWLAPLRGKDLYCFCPEGSPCHGDVLLELANRNKRQRDV